MAKNIILFRHAEALEPNIAIKDFDRPLTPQGAQDASRMGKTLRETQVKIDAFYSSSALRATETAERVAEQLPYDVNDIFFEEDIYNISLGKLLMFIQNLDSDLETVLILGHNPTITYFTEYITGEGNLHFSPANAALISFDIANWKEADKGKGKLEWVKKPIH
ncbi:histidine phosphatase family protein [Flammeovirgaceae bacterium SG7u.111]|nr:histidine phosphatase family protein [Flammeovirgaceae bacterium SG7u.132]WPO36421.1 histidine phosphatase family protein [Flammeovirgaceae bacterium SG7u.111]